MYSLSSFCSAVDLSGDSLKYMEKVMSTEVYAGQTETGLINRDEREKPAPCKSWSRSQLGHHTLKWQFTILSMSHTDWQVFKIEEN